MCVDNVCVVERFVILERELKVQSEDLLLDVVS